ncbi:MAG TPA: hypothetical protein PKL57_13800, partial [Candidatus Wallbacteria bacterium]|nr:hypothetical protein [Candidatus Wallbacteria bacterium]
NFKSTDTAVTSAFISNIEAYGSAAAPIVTSSTAASVAVPSEVTSIKFMGKGLVSTTGTFRTLYMKLKGTNDWKYLAGSNSILWTDNAITVKLYEPKPVGAFEIFIAETDFGAVTVSNIVNLVFGQAAGGATINSINSIAITPGMLVTLKSDFTQLEIMGMNFGVQSANLIVRFVPFPDPTNPNPIPFVFPTSSWSESFIKVGRPELPAGAKLMKGNIELFNKTLNKTIAVPVPVEFIDSTATNIPAVTGLKYDATMKKLMWNPATSATSSMMYAYILNIDGMIYEVPMGIYDFPVNMLQSGDHKAMVQAKIPGTYPPQAGPFSTPVTFTTTGGTVSNIPMVTGITYDPMMKIIKWVPVQTVTAEGWTQYYVYIVEIDGTVIPNPMSMAEYPVMNLTSGAHKVRVKAQKPGSYPPESGWFQDTPFTFTLEGGTGTAVPAVTGLMYDATMNKLKWNPISNTTTAAPYAYKLDIDGIPYGPFYMTEFFMPPNIPAGSHTAKIQAMMEAMPPQYGAFSTPITFTSVAGTTTGVPNIMTLTYESAMKKLMWTTDAPAATMGVTYFVSLDNQNPMPVQMMEFYMPPAFPDGKHTAKVWAQAFVNNMPIEGTPKMLEFTVGSTTGSLMAPVITYDSATKMLSWSPVTAPVAGAVVEYKIVVDGIQKMMWATPTSISMNNPNLISDFSVNHTVNVIAVIYSLNMESGLSNTVNTLGGGTTTAPVITGLKYDDATKMVVWNPIAPPTTGGTINYMISIDNITAVYTASSSYAITYTTGTHTAKVWAQLKSTTGVVTDGTPVTITFTVGGTVPADTTVYAGTYTGTFTGNPAPNGNLNIVVGSNGQGTVGGVNSTFNNYQFSNIPAIITAAGKINFTVKYAEDVYYEGDIMSTGSISNGKMYRKADMSYLGTWTASKGGTTTSAMTITGATNGSININITPAAVVMYSYTVPGNRNDRTTAPAIPNPVRASEFI